MAVFLSYFLKIQSAAIVQQRELPVSEEVVVKLIGFDGNITEKKLGQSTVQISGVRQKI